MQASEGERINLYLPKDLKIWLEKEANLDHRSLNNFVTLILQKHREKK